MTGPAGPRERRRERPSPLTLRIVALIRSIPRGSVATYGQIALLAGNPRATRAVVWILASSSSRERLPWHRVINRNGTISLPPGGGRELQAALLGAEGIVVDRSGQVDLGRHRWRPRRLPSRRPP